MRTRSLILLILLGILAFLGTAWLIVQPCLAADFNGKVVGIIDGDTDLPPGVRPPLKFLHADTLTGAKVRVSGAGGRYPSALCGRCVLY